MNNVGYWIKKRRIELRMNQKDLAIASGLSEPAIRVYERDGLPRERVQFDKMRRLMAALRVRESAITQMLEGAAPSADMLLPAEAEASDKMVKMQASAAASLTPDLIKLIESADTPEHLAGALTAAAREILKGAMGKRK